LRQLLNNPNQRYRTGNSHFKQGNTLHIHY
jgi:hypothetical protein